jgi:mannose/cellobiose epimerase-like protein (N-acyl-D-glucosamine 2-epimerase family)
MIHTPRTAKLSLGGDRPWKKILLLGLGFATVTGGGLPAWALPTGFPTSDRWQSHLKNELMPYWTSGPALGSPLGNFPSVRCNNGSLINYSQPCPEVNNGYLLQRRNTVVSMSRQTYGYCMAFHMTGDPQYLKYAKAGVDYLRRNAFDRARGGTYVYRDNLSGQWDNQPGLRNTQELAYALLGLSCYHYVTRDPAVLADITAAKNNIFQKYNNAGLGLIQWQLQDGNGDRALDRRFVAQVDQLSYMFLVTPDLPTSGQREQWKREMSKIADSMINQFYSPGDNLFFLRNNSPDDRNLQRTGTDFGHTAKGLWTLRLVGRLTGRQDLINFSRSNAPRLLDRAFLSGPGAWANGVKAGGALDGEKSWWIYAELDQLAGVMALGDANYANRLTRTYGYWFNYFVDRPSGEVWTGIQANGNRPLGGFPKAWFWKNAYHSVEHGMFGYVTTAQLERRPVVLYYAFQQPPASGSVRPHLFTGRLDSLTQTPDGTFGQIYRASFTNVGF